MFGFKSLTGQSLWLSGFSALAPVAAILSTEARPVREQRLEADRRLQWEPQWEALQAFQAGAGRLPASHPRPRVTSPSPELEQESRSVDELRSSLLLLAPRDPSLGWIWGGGNPARSGSRSNPRSRRQAGSPVCLSGGGPAAGASGDKCQRGTSPGPVVGDVELALSPCVPSISLDGLRFPRGKFLWNLPDPGSSPAGARPGARPRKGSDSFI